MPTSQARRKARAEKTALYRRLVLEAATRVFAEKGFDDARMDEIARESGISLQTLYSVFAGKASLHAAIQETGDRELHARVTAAADRSADPFAALLAGLRATTRYFLEHPDFLRMRLHGGFTWGAEAAAAGDRARTESWRAALERLRVACRRGIEVGLIVDRDPDLIARTVVAMQQVELAHWLEGDGKADPESVVRALEEQVERAFRRTDPAPARAAAGR